MSVAVAEREGSATLRVALIAADPMRRAGLATILRSLGYAIVEPDAADVILLDEEEPSQTGSPTVSLGGVEGGQAGLLPVDAEPCQIDAALRAVAAGLTVRTAPTVSGFRALEEVAAPLLTPREIEVLSAIGDGLSNKAVARRLGISQHTVKFHVESLFRKLGAMSRADAVRKGLKQRLLEL